MENAIKRHIAHLLLSGRETSVVRYALASRYARMFRRPRLRTVDRFALYDLVSRELIGGQDFDYLEFGVFEGASIARVAQLNQGAGVRLFGFDSFEGLPYDWNTSNPKSTFNTN